MVIRTVVHHKILTRLTSIVLTEVFLKGPKHFFILKYYCILTRGLLDLLQSGFIIFSEVLILSTFLIKYILVASYKIAHQ